MNQEAGELYNTGPRSEVSKEELGEVKALERMGQEIRNRFCQLTRRLLISSEGIDISEIEQNYDNIEGATEEERMHSKSIALETVFEELQSSFSESSQLSNRSAQLYVFIKKHLNEEQNHKIKYEIGEFDKKFSGKDKELCRAISDDRELFSNNVRRQ